MCELEDLSECAMNIVIDIIIRKPSKALQFSEILLKYSMSTKHNVCRQQALDKIEKIFHVVPESLRAHIKEHALNQMKLLVLSTPPESFLSARWTEDLTKICMTLILQLLPHNQGIFTVI